MPDLSRVAAVLGVPFTTSGGATFRATLRPPPPATPGFEGTFAPRQTILLPKDFKLPSAGVLADRDGNRFLHASWGIEGVMGLYTARSHVLFQVTGSEIWTRPTYTTEPISGQRIAGEPTVLGTLHLVREFVRRRSDALNVEEEIYRVLCVANLQVGDYLDARRVMRVENVRGLTYAEVF